MGDITEFSKWECTIHKGRMNRDHGIPLITVSEDYILNNETSNFRSLIFMIEAKDDSVYGKLEQAECYLLQAASS